MSKKTFELTGDKELISLLRRAAKKYPDETEKVIKNNAEKGKDLSASKAPVDTHFLRSSQNTAHPNKLEAHIKSEASYSGYVNFGTRFMEGRPFFTDMWEVTQKKVKEDLRGVFRKGIK